jgi:glycosyltransferase involved in cell wall biosynthesis
MSKDIPEKSKFSIIVPVYNERDNLLALSEEIASVFRQLPYEYEVIFIDDGSTDGSLDLLRDICDKNRQVKVIRLRRNSGQSAALKAGFDFATGDYIVSMDGDLQNDPGDIPGLIEAIARDYDVVCGWRAGRKDPLLKKVSSAFSNRLRKLLLGDSVHDYGCTHRIYRKSSLENIELRGDMHRYLPAIMAINGDRVGEIKVGHRSRRFGKTKYNWTRLFKGLSDLLLIAFWSRFAHRPMHIFGIGGMMLAGVGVVVTVYLLIMRLMYGIALLDRPLLAASLIAILMGVQFIAMGVLADIMLKVYFGQSKIKNYRVEQTINMDR